MTLTYNNAAAALQEADASGPGPGSPEPDDVATALGLSREINRIYGSYLQDDLAATEPLRRALGVTARLLTTLGATVRSGVATRRIDVAAAQTREILAVLFGVDAPGPRTTGPALEARPGHPEVTPGPDGAPGLALPSGASSPAAARARAAGRLVLGLVGYCLLGAVVDVPIAVLALFPADWVPLTAAFIGVPLTIWLFVLSRRPGRLLPRLSRYVAEPVDA